MAQKGVIDIWGLSEVRNQSALDTFHEKIEQATVEEYVAKLSNSGSFDRLAILYRKSVFDPKSDFFEISRIKVSQGLRPGFAIRLAGKKNDQEFMFMVNHLKCCFDKPSDFEKRRKQVRGMNSVADQNNDVPIIAVGDLNTRVSVETGELIDPAIKALIEGDGSYEWIRPKVLAQTEDNVSAFDDLGVDQPLRNAHHRLRGVTSMACMRQTIASTKDLTNRRFVGRFPVGKQRG